MAAPTGHDNSTSLTKLMWHTNMPACQSAAGGARRRIVGVDGGAERPRRLDLAPAVGDALRGRNSNINSKV